MRRSRAVLQRSAGTYFLLRPFLLPRRRPFPSATSVGGGRDGGEIFGGRESGVCHGGGGYVKFSATTVPQCVHGDRAVSRSAAAAACRLIVSPGKRDLVTANGFVGPASTSDNGVHTRVRLFRLGPWLTDIISTGWLFYRPTLVFLLVLGFFFQILIFKF